MRDEDGISVLLHLLPRPPSLPLLAAPAAVVSLGVQDLLHQQSEAAQKNFQHVYMCYNVRASMYSTYIYSHICMCMCTHK